MPLLIDEDWAKGNPSAVKRMGYTGVIGYVSEDTTGKNLTRSDVDGIHSVGMDVGLVYEYGTRQPLDGAGRGQKDAITAVLKAGGLGAPRGVCLYVAVDFDITVEQLPPTRAYLDAYQAYCAKNGYRAGAYGSYRLCQYLYHSGWAGLLWQTYAWSNGAWADGLALRQVHNGVSVGGAVVDQDVSQVTDWGQWSPKAGSDVSQVTDNIVKAYSVGQLTTVDESGNTIPVEPSRWEADRKMWQASVDGHLEDLSTAVGGIQATLAGLSAGAGGLTLQQTQDLHAIAVALAKLTA